MDSIKDEYVGLALLANLNWDHFLFMGTALAALGAAAYIVTH